MKRRERERGRESYPIAYSRSERRRKEEWGSSRMRRRRRNRSWLRFPPVEEESGERKEALRTYRMYQKKNTNILLLW